MTPHDSPTSPGATSPGATSTGDPVRAKRARIARWTLLANRVGYLCLAVAMALFVIAFAIGFTPTTATLVLVPLLTSFVLLAPSIVVGYAVKAAEREDRERGH